ncbi:hypothetical protein Tco_0816142 [Tanacetum coccineum]
MLSGGGTNTHTSSLLNWRNSSRIESIHAGSVMRVLLSLVPEGDLKSTDIHKESEELDLQEQHEQGFELLVLTEHKLIDSELIYLEVIALKPGFFKLRCAYKPTGEPEERGTTKWVLGSVGWVEALWAGVPWGSSEICGWRIGNGEGNTPHVMDRAWGGAGNGGWVYGGLGGPVGGGGRGGCGGGGKVSREYRGHPTVFGRVEGGGFQAWVVCWWSGWAACFVRFCSVGGVVGLGGELQQAGRVDEEDEA